MAGLVDNGSDDDLESFDREFIRVNKSTILDLNMATDHVKVTGLLDLACSMLTDMHNYGQDAGADKEFDLLDDDGFTPEEQEQISCKNA